MTITAKEVRGRSQRERHRLRPAAHAVTASAANRTKMSDSFQVLPLGGLVQTVTHPGGWVPGPGPASASRAFDRR